ncbi:hypothetical protein ACFQS7_17175 [Dankookia sp. GCM10030260]|uniref:hypothetical protein n=1 Tax=Dankookia sp. GCM10030260 TaxID=3273390 RepID=UPI00360607AE
MRIHTLTLALVAAVALTACADVKTTSGPPVAGTAAGPGSAPLTQQARDTMGANSANASSGTATITGTRSGGDGGAKPQIGYTGAAPSGGAGSPTPVPLPTGGRREGNKGS